MLKANPITAVVALALLVGATASTSAASIKDQLTDHQITTICANHLAGAEVDAAATLASGAFVSGTVHCEARDIMEAHSSNASVSTTNSGASNSWSTGDDDDSNDDDHDGGHEDDSNGDHHDYGHEDNEQGDDN